ncbi:6-bladed beta-propeller [Parabacteroides sp. PF5-6]|uniref:6-bladed beta-propeller n=1 Tax=Parabacteroides sp. PF5-6 TaxID=1742403 RepID=UPI002404A472|nr:6-bladed beta-propeller [Parabacteroides sp. PF5-6]MDF9828723.1 hypothetical protein [Parabacteroides sp. PF5-6]
MKTHYLLFLYCSFLILCGCSTKKGETVPEILIFDLTQKYPVKEIYLQDIAEVSYIPLETRDDMLWKGPVSGLGEDLILNVEAMKGDILLFDGRGKAIRHIKRQGGSAEEYSGIISVVCDEQQKELFVKSNSMKKILVYDLEGNYKRTLAFIPERIYRSFAILDANHLIAFSKEHEAGLNNNFFILSKEDGRLVKALTIPAEKEIPEILMQTDANNNTSIATIASYPITPTSNGLFVQDLSSDTIFSFDPATLSLHPAIVRTPSIHVMESEIFLYTLIDSPGYTYFMTMERANHNTQHSGYPRKYYIHDKKKGEIYEALIANKDHPASGHSLILSGQRSKMSPGTNGIGFKTLDPMELLDAYESNQLQGRLKEIAKELDEEDNPVIMVAKFR